MQFVNNAIDTLSKKSDLILAVVIVSIIFMMIVPLPTLLVDVIIAVNLATAVVLLMIAVYIPTPLAFSAFPTILLITTLSRLSLSVSTTRLILLVADAGEIIYAFGNFVVQGNMIVGLIIFLIITIVNFVVVTKGSERVAEVSARFSLDGMPGKQMSIDSDMRSGVITLAEARQRRKDLENENKLFGSMDGAMKFVKGDAIAGLIIIFMNIIGGLSIGVMQQGMSAGDALELYSILTIGDGLVSQIPALFISVTAGMIVTRVGADGASNIGTEISEQILAYPKALMIGAVLLFFMAWIPGFPTVIFLGLAALIGIVGFFLHQSETQGAGGMIESSLASAEGGPSPTPSQNKGDLLPNAPVILEVANNFRELINPVLLNTELAKVRRVLYQSVGVPFPGVHLRFNGEADDGHYSIFLYDVPITQGAVKNDAIFTVADESVLELLNVPFEVSENFLPGIKTIWVENEYQPLLAEKQINTLAVAQIFSHHLAHVLRRHAYQFVGIQETHTLLNQAEARYSELIKEVFRHMPISQIANVLRELVREGITITNLRAILEGLVAGKQHAEDIDKLVAFVRASLKDQISYKYCDGNILPVYLIDDATEAHMMDSLRQTPQGISLAMNATDTRNFIDNIKQLISSPDYPLGKVALLTSADLRRYIRKLIEIDFYELPVLSYSELAAQITVQPIGKISLAQSGS